MTWTVRATCIFLLLPALTASAAEPAGPKRVLILHSFGRDFAPFNIMASSFRTELARQSREPLEFHEASLDSARFGDGEIELPLLEYLKSIFAKRRPDLVVTIAEPATAFYLLHRLQLFPNSPWVAHIEQRKVAMLTATNMSIVPIQVDLADIVENILQLFPETANILVILGSSPLERFWTSACQSQFGLYADRIAFSYSNDLTLEETCQRVASMPARSTVLYGMMAVDAAGVPNEEEKALASLRAATRVPIFGVFSHQLGHGIVGGPLISQEAVGREVACTALRLMHGGPPGIHPAIRAGPPVYDWREVQRWGIPLQRLPPRSELQFRAPTQWEQHKWQILGAFTFCAVETVLIVALLAQSRRRRRVEGNLRESEKRMELAAIAANFGVWVWEIPADEIWGSDKGRALLGFNQTERFSYARFERALHPDDRARVRRALQQALEGGGDYEAEFRVPLTSGQTRWIAARGRVEFDGKRQPVRLHGTVIDISQRKQAEVDAKLSHDALAHASRVATMGELSASLAHELNQPLSAILSNAQAVQRFLATDAPDLGEVREALHDIAGDANRAGEVIRRMRAMVKGTEIELLPIDLDRLIRDVAELLHSDAVIRNVTVSLELTPDLPPVRGDQVQLQQVVLNILLNAFEALNGKQTPERIVTVRAAPLNGEAIRVSVIDRGTGLSDEQLGRLFEPFQTTKPHGLGMGLAISRSIIEVHGGRLWGENNPDTGATFCFELPIDGHH